ncbi:hypothetical protein [Methylorubrum extorquens]|uniref:hypothetical protein n=1 Tax=Methylorubrum extorquens TaxID=408 RepID=UPI0020A108D4|nr:hypothetical protein [Methylorubrum extorquens]MCP1540005.1 hypothetical protein [Methylorubrum extorquens]
MTTKATTKKKVPARGVRGRNPQQKLEAAVAGVGRSITALVKLVEREGVKLKASEVEKAFSFLALAGSAAQQKALASVQAAGLSDFSLAKDLPALAGIAAPAVVPLIALPGSPAPAAPRGPSVNDLGGRFVSEARRRPETPAEPAADDDALFLDEDEDNNPTDVENDE